MAVAMEVAWRGGGVGELASSSTPPVVSIQDVEASLKVKSSNAGSTSIKMKKRAWGADAHKLVQLMMNPLHQQQQQQQQSHAPGVLPPRAHAGGELGGTKEVADVEEEEELTLDLLGASSPPTKSQKLAEEEKDELRELELQPADQPFLPLPSGWEKCLDLKTGKLYFVNKSTGVSTSPEITNNKCCTHKFLTNKLKSSSSSSSEELEQLEELMQTSTCPSQPALPPLLAFSSGSKQLNLIKTPHGDHPRAKEQEISASKFALDLNLTASGSTSPSHHHHHQPSQPQPQQEQVRPESSSAAVCTMEMVQRALNRAEKAMGKREMQAPRNPHRHHHPHHHSGAAAASSSSSSAHVGGAMSEATSSRSPNSTTTSSNSSSTSSTSSAGLLAGPSGGAPTPTTTTTTTTEGGILEVVKEEQAVEDPFLVTSESGVWEGGESKEHSLQRKMEDGKDESEATASGQSMLVMGACTRCLMYVMLNKCDPKCPRCESQVPLDFTNAPPKRQGLERPESPSELTQV